MLKPKKQLSFFNSFLFVFLKMSKRYERPSEDLTGTKRIHILCDCEACEVLKWLKQFSGEDDIVGHIKKLQSETERLLLAQKKYNEALVRLSQVILNRTEEIGPMNDMELLLQSKDKLIEMVDELSSVEKQSKSVISDDIPALKVLQQTYEKKIQQSMSMIKRLEVLRVLLSFHQEDVSEYLKSCHKLSEQKQALDSLLVE